MCLAARNRSTASSADSPESDDRPERLDDRSGNILGPVEGSERDEAGAVDEVALDCAGGLQREPRLADPAGAGEREQPRRAQAQPLSDRRKIVPAADRAVGRHRQPAPALGAEWRRPRLGAERVGVSKDVLVELAQRLGGLDAELLHESRAGGVEGRQRVGLSSAAIQREHLQLDEALLEGMRDDQRFQLPQQLAVPAQLQVELDALDDRGQSLLLQPRALGGEQRVRADSPERLAAPDTERVLDPLPGDARLAVGTRPTRSVERLLPAVEIALSRLQLQQVAARVT